MHYLYHAVPHDMRGTILYPLNILKDTQPDLYKNLVKKYIGREDVTLLAPVPPLDCLWNDVLYFSPVHPQEIQQALIEITGNSFHKKKFYQIDPMLLDPQKTTVYLPPLPSEKNQQRPEDFVNYIPQEMEKYSTLPDITKRYYKKAHDLGWTILAYNRVPQILYKGSLDITNIPIITIE